jgi:hypothetical protein
MVRIEKREFKGSQPGAEEPVRLDPTFEPRLPRDCYENVEKLPQGKGYQNPTEEDITEYQNPEERQTA